MVSICVYIIIARRTSGHFHAQELQERFGKALEEGSTEEKLTKKHPLPPTAQLFEKFAPASFSLVSQDNGLQSRLKESPESGYDSNGSISGGSDTSLLALYDPNPSPLHNSSKVSHATMGKLSLNRPLQEQLIPTSNC